MARVDAAFHRLQPVAFLEALRRVGLRGGHRRELVLRKRRLRFRRSHVGPEDAAALDERVRGQLHLLRKRGVLRLVRHVDALAGDVVLPAVIRAAQSALLVAAEPERDATVRAELVHQAVASLAVAERDEPLRQQLHAHRGTVVPRKLFREQRGNPVAAKRLPERRVRSRLRQEVVLFFPQHVVIVYCPKERSP